MSTVVLLRLPAPLPRLSLLLEAFVRRLLSLDVPFASYLIEQLLVVLVGTTEFLALQLLAHSLRALPRTRGLRRLFCYSWPRAQRPDPR